MGRTRCREELSKGPHETRERTHSLTCHLARCCPMCLVPGSVNPVSQGHALCVLPPHQWLAPPGSLSFSDDIHCVARLCQPCGCLACRLLDLANKIALSSASDEGGCGQNIERSKKSRRATRASGVCSVATRRSHGSRPGAEPELSRGQAHGAQ